MKLAIAGKGGSGKTSISGTLARLIARDGHTVLAIDGDTNPNLALTLGIPADRINDLPVLPTGLLERGDDGFELKKSLEELRSTHSVSGPDGVTLLVMAHPQEEDAGSGCYCGMHATVRELIESATDADADVTLLDTEASPEHLTRGTAKYADVMLTVVEPYFKSLETGRRMAELARGLGLKRVLLVANKVRDENEQAAVDEFAAKHDLEIIATVPYDEKLLEAERAEAAPLDFAADAPAVEAIGGIARSLGANGTANVSGHE
ncbi:MAG TPA: ArsA-related P-loop ATPase [Solirubrobacterales bacterium]|nr:ArsA-related P-loop ATPase [Solirubrobacterales bacterium]